MSIKFFLAGMKTQCVIRMLLSNNTPGGGGGGGGGVWVAQQPHRFQIVVCVSLTTKEPTCMSLLRFRTVHRPMCILRLHAGM
jgi:hypothetical protein